MAIRSNQNSSALTILLADDDRDDRFFFKLALKELSCFARLINIYDGEKLMDYLLKNSENLPDVLFLDLNMPKKNGAECLSEIKQNPKLKELKVIIYSTSVRDDVADQLYNNGAYHYVRKCEFIELKDVLRRILSLIENKICRPKRTNFIFNPAKSKPPSYSPFFSPTN